LSHWCRSLGRQRFAVVEGYLVLASAQPVWDNAEKSERLLSDLLELLTRREAEKVQTPALLLTGDRSPRMFQLIVEERARCISNNELVRVPESTHEMPADNPEAYNSIVLSFLKKQ
jgi:pimeloyl-ACP methyl ester carboxylesterase